MSVQRARRLVPLLEAFERAGLSKSYGFARIKAGTFPLPVKIGRSSLIVESELDAWIETRIAERDAGKAGA